MSPPPLSPSLRGTEEAEAIPDKSTQGHVFAMSPPPLSPSWRGTGGGYGEEQKCADNEVWQSNRQFVK